MARGIANPFNPQDPDWVKKSAAPAKPKTRKVSISPAGKRRAMSVGVSSTKRHATKKRPH